MRVEFAWLDFASIAPGSAPALLGVFRRADYEAQFGGRDVAFAEASAVLTNAAETEIVRNQVRLNLPDREPVVMYLEISGDERIVRDLAGRKEFMDTVPSSGNYFYALASVDAAGNISQLSPLVKVSVK